MPKLAASGPRGLAHRTFPVNSKHEILSCAPKRSALLQFLLLLRFWATLVRTSRCRRLSGKPGILVFEHVGMSLLARAAIPSSNSSPAATITPKSAGFCWARHAVNSEQADRLLHRHAGRAYRLLPRNGGRRSFCRPRPIPLEEWHAPVPQSAQIGIFLTGPWSPRSS
jgi:hypothetical protein